MVGFHSEAYGVHLAKFNPSLRLTSLRQQRRRSQDTQIRRQLTFTIQKLQKQEIGTWNEVVENCSAYCFTIPLAFPSRFNPEIIWPDNRGASICT